nr:MAG TPA: hypothetical protein [Caudoviricetes sp.]
MDNRKATRRGGFLLEKNKYKSSNYLDNTPKRCYNILVS